MRDPLVQTERGDRPGVLVRVVHDGPTAHHRGDVLRQHPRLPDGVLGVGGALPARLVRLGRALRRQVRYGRGVPRRPGVFDALHPEGGGAFQTAAFGARQAGSGDERVRFDARGPHESASREACAVTQDGDPPLVRLQARVQPYVDVARPQLPYGVLPHRRPHLRQDAAGRLDQDPLHVTGLDVVVVARRVARHVLQLRERLHPRVPAADEDEGQRGVADRRVAGRGGDVQLLQDVVAQADGLLDGLETDAALGEARDRQGAGDRTGRQHQLVVGQLQAAGAVLLGGRRRDRGGPRGVVERGDLPDDDLAERQHPAQRHDDVPRRDGAGRGLGEKRLIRHVRIGVHHDHLDGGPPEFLFQFPLQAQRGVHPHVAAADNENARRFLHRGSPRDIERPARAGCHRRPAGLPPPGTVPPEGHSTVP